MKLSSTFLVVLTWKESSTCSHSLGRQDMEILTLHCLFTQGNLLLCLLTTLGEAAGFFLHNSGNNILTAVFSCLPSCCLPLSCLKLTVVSHCPQEEVQTSHLGFQISVGSSSGSPLSSYLLSNSTPQCLKHGRIFYFLIYGCAKLTLVSGPITY